MSATPRMSSALTLRLMSRDDVAAIMAIEVRAYEFPWTEGIFRDCLRVGDYCAVGVEADEIVAYGVMSCGAGEAHVLNLCVRPESRSRGYGRQILAALMARAREHKAETMFLEVRPSNQAALDLYLSEGFNEVGLRPNYYPALKGREDALVLAKVLNVGGVTPH